MYICLLCVSLPPSLLFVCVYARYMALSAANKYHMYTYIYVYLYIYISSCVYINSVCVCVSLSPSCVYVCMHGASRCPLLTYIKSI